MMKRFLLLFTFLLAAICLLCPCALAADAIPIVGGTQIEQGKFYIGDGEGGITTEGASAQRYNVKYENGALTLKDAWITKTNKDYNAAVFCNGDLKLVLEGSSSVKGADVSGDGSESRGVFCGGKLEISGGRLMASGGKAGSVSIGVCGGKSITLNGCTLYAAGGESNNSGGVNAYTGGLSINGGTLYATGGKAAQSSFGVDVTSGAVTLEGSAQVVATGGSGVGASSNSFGVRGLDVTVAEDARLTATGGAAKIYSRGILAERKLDIAGDVSATGGAAQTSYGISCNNCAADIASTAVVTATGGAATDISYGIDNNNGSFTIKGGTVTATGGTATGTNSTAESHGIYNNENSSLTVESGKLTATGGSATATSGDSYSVGISNKGTFTVNGGTVTATGGLADSSSGIYNASGSLTMGGGLIVSRSAKDLGGGEIVQGTFNARLLTKSNELNFAVYCADGNQSSYNVSTPTSVMKYEASTVSTTGNGITWNKDSRTLTLNNAIINSRASDAIEFASDLTGDVTVELIGVNVVKSGDQPDGGIAIYGDDKNGVKFSGGGSLIAIGGYATNANASSTGIFTHGKVTVNNVNITAIGGTAGGNKQTSSSGFSSAGAEISGGDITAIGGTASTSSTGLHVGGYAELVNGTITAIGGTVHEKSYGMTANKASVKGGRITAIGGSTSSATGDGSKGFEGGADAEISGGSFRATGGTASSQSYGVYITGIPGTKLSVTGGSVTAMGGKSDRYSYGVQVIGECGISGGSVIASGGKSDISSYGLHSKKLSISNGSVIAAGGEAQNNSHGAITEEEASVEFSGGDITAAGGAVTGYSSFGFHGQQIVTIKGGTLQAAGITALNAAGSLTLGENVGIIQPIGGRTDKDDAIHTRNGKDPAKYALLRGYANGRLGTPTNLGWQNELPTAAWSKVENAACYLVQLYLEGDSKAPYRQIATSGTSLDLSDAMNKAGKYTFTVTAIGGDNYRDSAESEKSGVFNCTNPSNVFTVTVTGGTGGGSYKAGATVSITATVPSGSSFVGWSVQKGGITLADTATTTFVMPLCDVEVSVRFYTPPTPQKPETKESFGQSEIDLTGMKQVKKGVNEFIKALKALNPEAKKTFAYPNGDTLVINLNKLPDKIWLGNTLDYSMLTNSGITTVSLQKNGAIIVLEAERLSLAQPDYLNIVTGGAKLQIPEGLLAFEVENENFRMYLDGMYAAKKVSVPVKTAGPYSVEISGKLIELKVGSINDRKIVNITDITQPKLYIIKR